MGRLSRREFETKEGREFRIRKAMQMAALDPQTGLRMMTIREADAAYSLAYTTLRAWLAGSQKSVVAQEGRQLFTPLDEKAVLRWIVKLESCGFPPKIDHVKRSCKAF